MEIQIDGKPLSEVAPEAIKFFDAEKALRTTAIAALVKSIYGAFESKIRVLEEELKTVLKANEQYHNENIAFLDQVEILQAKIDHKKRPKPGGRPFRERKLLQKEEVLYDRDDTTDELLKEAYPASKSETRRHAIMKKSEVNRGK